MIKFNYYALYSNHLQSIKYNTIGMNKANKTKLFTILCGIHLR